MNVFDCIADQAALRPDHPAVIEDGPRARMVTYGELVRNVRRRAAELERRGIRPAWRVGMIVPQGEEFIETALAILAAGACMVPIADDHPPATIADIVRRAHLHVLLQNPGHQDPGEVQILEQCPARLPAVDAAAGSTAVAQAAGAAQARREDACAAPPAHPFASTPLAPDIEAAFAATGPAYLRFTSGTTSERKGVVIGHTRILERLEAANRGLAIGPDDRVLWLLPMAHHFVVSILLYLRYGATILLPVEFRSRRPSSSWPRASARPCSTRRRTT